MADRVSEIKVLDPVESADQVLALLKSSKLSSEQLKELRDYWRNNKICVHQKVGYYLMCESGVWDGPIGAIGVDTSGKDKMHWEGCKCPVQKCLFGSSS